jgi:hypothetical protein
MEHDGELPPSEGHSTAVNISTPPGGFTEKAEVLDICALVGDEEDMLRMVPYGPVGSAGDAGTNFYTGNCNRSTEDNGHYVFFVDAVGNVYTGCDCNENGVIDEDGMENVSDYSGNCSPDSKAGDDVPVPGYEYKMGWWDTYGGLFKIFFALLFPPIFVICIYFILPKESEAPKDDNDSDVSRE